MDVPKFLQSRSEDIRSFLPLLFHSSEAATTAATAPREARRGVPSYRRSSSKNIPLAVVVKAVHASYEARKRQRQRIRRDQKKSRAAAERQKVAQDAAKDQNNNNKKKDTRPSTVAGKSAAWSIPSVATSAASTSRLGLKQQQRVWACRLRRRKLRLRPTAERRRQCRRLDQQRGKPLLQRLRFVSQPRSTTGCAEEEDGQELLNASTGSLLCPSHRSLRPRYHFTTIRYEIPTAQLPTLQRLQQQQQQQLRRRRLALSEKAEVESVSTSASLCLTEDVTPTTAAENQTEFSQLSPAQGASGVLQASILVAVRRTQKQFKKILSLGSSWNRHRGGRTICGQHSTITGIIQDASYRWVWRLTPATDNKAAGEEDDDERTGMSAIIDVLQRSGGFFFAAPFSNRSVRGYIRRTENHNENAKHTPLISPCLLVAATALGGFPLADPSPSTTESDSFYYYLVTEEIPESFIRHASSRSHNNTSSQHPVFPWESERWCLPSSTTSVSLVSTWSPFVYPHLERVSVFCAFIRPLLSTNDHHPQQNVDPHSLAMALEQALLREKITSTTTSTKMMSGSVLTTTSVSSVIALANDAIRSTSGEFAHSTTTTWPFLILCRSVADVTASEARRTFTTAESEAASRTVMGSTVHAAELLRRAHFCTARRVFRTLQRLPLSLQISEKETIFPMQPCRLRPVGIHEVSFFLRQLGWRAYPESFTIKGYPQSIACSTATQQVLVRFPSKHALCCRHEIEDTKNPTVLLCIQPLVVPGEPPRRQLQVSIVGSRTATTVQEHLPAGEARGVFFCWDVRQYEALLQNQSSNMNNNSKAQGGKTRNEIIEDNGDDNGLRGKEEDDLHDTGDDAERDSTTISPLYIITTSLTAQFLKTMEKLQRGYSVVAQPCRGNDSRNSLRAEATRLWQQIRHSCEDSQRCILGSSFPQDLLEKNKKRDRCGSPIKQQQQTIVLPTIRDVLVCPHCCARAEFV